MAALKKRMDARDESMKLSDYLRNQATSAGVRLCVSSLTVVLVSCACLRRRLSLRCCVTPGCCVTLLRMRPCAVHFAACCLGSALFRLLICMTRFTGGSRQAGGGGQERGPEGAGQARGLSELPHMACPCCVAVYFRDAVLNLPSPQILLDL